MEERRRIELDFQTLEAIGDFFGEFATDNIDEMNDEYLDYLNKIKEDKDKKFKFVTLPEFCFRVMLYKMEEDFKAGTKVFKHEN